MKTSNLLTLLFSLYQLSLCLLPSPFSPVYQNQFIISIKICLIFFLIKPTGIFPILLIQQFAFSTLDLVLLRGKNVHNHDFTLNMEITTFHKAFKIALQSSYILLIRSIIPIFHTVLFNLLPFPQPSITVSINFSRYIPQKK